MAGTWQSHAKEQRCVGSILKPLCCPVLPCPALLCPALPWALLCSMDLYECSTADAAAAVSMLEQLPRLRGIRLGIHAYWKTEEDYLYPDLDDWHAWVGPPAMAGLGALTELALAGAASLPLDWRQLSALQRLQVTVDSEFGRGVETADGDVWHFVWGDAPLTTLTALTSLRTDGGPGDYGVMPGEAVPAPPACG